MVAQRMETGFTIIEVVVAIFVMSLFLTLFFNMFLTAQSQQVIVTRLAAANDVSLSNLRKVSDHSTSLPSCGASNDLTQTPAPAGTDMFSQGFSPESLTNTPLPPSTTQSLQAFYPYGCSANILLIQATTSFNSGTQNATHATYVLK